MTHPLFTFERRGMFGTLLWLRTYSDDPEKRYTSAILTGVGSNWESMGYIRDHLKEHGLVDVHGQPRTGQGQRVTLQLTERGEEAEIITRKIDAALRRVVPNSRTPSARPAALDPSTNPIMVTERPGVWKTLLHLLEHADDPDARFRRRIEFDNDISTHTFQDVRERLFDIGILEEQGVANGGRGARLTYSLTPEGVKIAALGQQLDEFLAGATRPKAPKPRAKKAP